MRAGFYYSTTGPKIHAIAFNDGQLTVECSAARRVTFSTLPWLSKRVMAADNNPITKTSVTLESIGSPTRVAAFMQQLVKQKMLSAPKAIKPHVRIEIDDGHGGFAWSNPIPMVE